MSLKIYFLRHGETPNSRTGNFCGGIDPKLTNEGIEMAKSFTHAYSSLPWNAIYVSPMKRTIATAKYLSDAIGMEMQLRDGLKEIQFGEWEDKSTQFVKENYGEIYYKWVAEPAWNAPPQGETALQVATRASSVIAEIEAKYNDGNILVVSHKATIRIILCSLLGIDLGRYRDRLNILTASLTVIKFSEYGPLLEKLGDRYHLPESLRNLPGT